MRVRAEPDKRNQAVVRMNEINPEPMRDYFKN